jgi:hypothetical protein
MIALLALPVALAAFLPASAPATTARQATVIMTTIKADSALIQKDEQTRSQSTSMAAITIDTTQMESQLQSMSIPISATVDVSILLKTAYKLGYDAASLQPVVGTTDTTLLHTLNNQVTADESVFNADTIQVISALNPLTIVAPAKIVEHHPAPVAKKANLTWHNWRNATVVQDVVRPVIATGWHILELLTGLSVIVMIRRLFRRSHGLTP